MNTSTTYHISELDIIAIDFFKTIMTPYQVLEALKDGLISTDRKPYSFTEEDLHKLYVLVDEKGMSFEEALEVYQDSDEV